MANHGPSSRRTYGCLCATLYMLAALTVGLCTSALARQSSEAAAPGELVDQLQRAVAAKAEATVETVTTQLTAQGEAALPAIEAGLTRGDDALSGSLLRVLGGIGGDGSTSLLVGVIGSAVSAELKGQAVGRLENRPVRRALSAAELNGLVDLVTNGSDIGAGGAARVLGKCLQVDPAVRLRPVLARLSQAVIAGADLPPVHGSYVSSRVYMLNQYLLAVSYIGAPAIPDLAAARQSVTDPELQKWLLLAAGMAGDASAAPALETVVRADPDRYVRCVAIRAYAASAGQNAMPLLQSLLDDETVSEHGNDTFGKAGRPRYLLRDAAKGALFRLTHAQD